MILQLSCSLLNRLRKTCSNKKTLTNQFVQDSSNKTYTNECWNQICLIKCYMLSTTMGSF